VRRHPGMRSRRTFRRGARSNEYGLTNPERAGQERRASARPGAAYPTFGACETAG